MPCKSSTQALKDVIGGHILARLVSLPAADQLARLPAEARAAVERSVLQASHVRIAFERSWYRPLGLDPDAHKVQPLADFLPPR